MSKKDTPTGIPSVLPQATDELSKALEEHRRNVPFLIEYQQLQAKVTRSKYLALINEGFTTQQALELCKERNVYEQ